uniref:CSON005341 protein n=1 Tax=Culicoides sonorensis TaxID=179676 RepID=A0A336M6X7_CULSO
MPNICKLCLFKAEIDEEGYLSTKNVEKTVKIINEIFSGKVKITQNEVRFICRPCYVKIENFYEYYLFVIENQELYYEKFGCDLIPSESAESKVEVFVEPIIKIDENVEEKFHKEEFSDNDDRDTQTNDDYVDGDEANEDVKNVQIKMESKGRVSKRLRGEKAPDPGELPKFWTKKRDFESRIKSLEEETERRPERVKDPDAVRWGKMGANALKRKKAANKGIAKKFTEIKLPKKSTETEPKEDKTGKRVELEERDALIKKYFSITCDECTEQKFETFTELNRHMKQEHKLKKHYICCGVLLPTGMAIYHHCIEHENPIQCQFCGMLCVSNAMHKLHLLQVHQIEKKPEEEAPYECHHCHRRFPDKERIKLHILRTHVWKKETSFVCETCARSYKSQNALTIHIRRDHMGEKLPKSQCPHCGKWLLNTGMPFHIRKHMTPKPTEKFKCDKCGAQLTTKYNLVIHTKRHHSELSNRFQCPQCPKGFFTKRHLDEHFAVHTGENLYHCEFCGAGFKSMGNFLAHKRKLHTLLYEQQKLANKIMPNVCKLCLFKAEIDEEGYLSTENIEKTLKIIKAIFNGKVKITQNEVRFICRLCYVKIENFYDYYLFVIENQELYYEKLGCDLIPIESAESKVEVFVEPIIKIDENVEEKFHQEEFSDNDDRDTQTNDDYVDGDEANEDVKNVQIKIESKGRVSKRLRGEKAPVPGELPKWRVIKRDFQSRTKSLEYESERQPERVKDPDAVRWGKMAANARKRKKAANKGIAKKFTEIKVPKKSKEPKPKEAKTGKMELEERDAMIKKYFSITCDKCTDQTFETFTELNRHTKQEHKFNKHYTCCGVFLTNGMAIYQHCLEHENPIQCQFCGMVCVSNAMHKLHLLQVHQIVKKPEEEAPYECDHCHRRYPDKERIEVHMMRTHLSKQETSYVCETCARSYKGQSALSVHIRRDHMGEKLPKSQCPHCGKWILNTGMPFHIRKHMTPKPTEKFKCDKCNAQLTTKYNLVIHTKRHHSEFSNRFQCPQCPKGFYTKRYLDEHFAVHTGENLYHCEFCGAGFKSMGNFLAHKRKLHTLLYEQQKLANKCNIFKTINLKLNYS